MKVFISLAFLICSICAPSVDRHISSSKSSSSSTKILEHQEVQTSQRSSVKSHTSESSHVSHKALETSFTDYEFNSYSSTRIIPSDSNSGEFKQEGFNSWFTDNLEKMDLSEKFSSETSQKFKVLLPSVSSESVSSFTAEVKLRNENDEEFAKQALQFFAQLTSFFEKSSTASKIDHAGDDKLKQNFLKTSQSFHTFLSQDTGAFDEKKKEKILSMNVETIDQLKKLLDHHEERLMKLKNSFNLSDANSEEFEKIQKLLITFNEVIEKHISNLSMSQSRVSQAIHQKNESGKKVLIKKKNNEHMDCNFELTQKQICEKISELAHEKIEIPNGEIIPQEKGDQSKSKWDKKYKILIKQGNKELIHILKYKCEMVKTSSGKPERNIKYSYALVEVEPESKEFSMKSIREITNTMDSDGVSVNFIETNLGGTITTQVINADTEEILLKESKIISQSSEQSSSTSHETSTSHSSSQTSSINEHKSTSSTKTVISHSNSEIISSILEQGFIETDAYENLSSKTRENIFEYFKSSNTESEKKTKAIMTEHVNNDKKLTDLTAKLFTELNSFLVEVSTTSKSEIDQLLQNMLKTSHRSVEIISTGLFDMNKLKEISTMESEIFVNLKKSIQYFKQQLKNMKQNDPNIKNNEKYQKIKKLLKDFENEMINRLASLNLEYSETSQKSQSHSNQNSLSGNPSNKVETSAMTCDSVLSAEEIQKKINEIANKNSPLVLPVAEFKVGKSKKSIAESEIEYKFQEERYLKDLKITNILVKNLKYKCEITQNIFGKLRIIQYRYSEEDDLFPQLVEFSSIWIIHDLSINGNEGYVVEKQFEDKKFVTILNDKLQMTDFKNENLEKQYSAGKALESGYYFANIDSSHASLSSSFVSTSSSRVSTASSNASSRVSSSRSHAS